MSIQMYMKGYLYKDSYTASIIKKTLPIHYAVNPYDEFRNGKAYTSNI